MENVAFPETMSPAAVDFIEKLIRKNPDERMKATEALKHKFLAQIDE
jgi:serine/threonine protein kinase